jgi:serine/threonine protein kinase
VLKKYVVDGHSSWSKLLNEVKLLKRLEHPNVAFVVGAFLENDGADQYGFIQMPYYARGTLEGLCVRDGSSPRALDEYQLQALMHELLRGVEHIHRSDVVHCDLKPANIFLSDGPDGSLQPKIGDFDVSKDNTERTLWAGTTATRSTVAGTVDYMAPELFKGQRATPASDIFSFALMLFELHFPRASRPSGLSLSSGRQQLSLPSHSNPALIDLLGRMLSVDPARRPTATQALSHAYFTSSLLVKQEELSRQMADLRQQQMTAQESQRQLEVERFRLEGEVSLQKARLQQESNRLQKQEQDLQGEIAREHKLLQELGRAAVMNEQQQAAMQAREEELAVQRARLAAQEQDAKKQAEKTQKELEALRQREHELDKKKSGLEKEKQKLLKCKVMTSPPPYWDTRSLRLDQPCRLVETADLLKEVQAVITSTCISRHIGIGRDSHGLKHTGFKVVRVQRIENPLLWSKYQIEREGVRANLPPGGPSSATQLDCYSAALWKAFQIQIDVNEALLWHGTKPDLWDPISRQGLDERLASNGMFGHGIYFAENSSKSDEYIVPDHNGNCYIFFVRVCLGEVHSTLAATSGMKRPPPRSDKPSALFDSVRAECQEHAKYGKPAAQLQRYRELIVFDRKLTYPELLVTFKRVK